MREDICAGATWTSTSEQTSSDSSSAPSFTSRSANKIEPEHEHERRQEHKEPASSCLRSRSPPLSLSLCPIHLSIQKHTHC